jgi:hypothetical protein
MEPKRFYRMVRIMQNLPELKKRLEALEKKIQGSEENE